MIGWPDKAKGKVYNKTVEPRKLIEKPKTMLQLLEFAGAVCVHVDPVAHF